MYAFSGSACLMLPGVAQTFRGRRYTDCESAAERHFRAIDQRRYQYVLLAERWLVYSPAQWAALDHTVARILAAGATPVIFRQVAEDEVRPAGVLQRAPRCASLYRNHCGIDQNTPFQRDKRPRWPPCSTGWPGNTRPCAGSIRNNRCATPAAA